MSFDDLHDWAEDILESVVAAWDGLPQDPPDRQYVTVGAPVLFCEQVVVWVRQERPDGQNTCSVYSSVAWAVTLTRCWPSLTKDADVPPADDLMERAAVLNGEGHRLWKYLQAQAAGKTLIAGMSCEVVQWEAMRPLGPSGGFAGWQIDFTTQEM